MRATATPAGTGARWLVVGSVGVGLFAAALDSSVNVALPAMASALGVGLPALQWIIIAFVATNTALSLGAGGAADRFGADRFFIGGLALYAAAMVLIALAPNLQVLVAFRVLQGVGAAAVLTVGPALVAAAFPPSQRGRVLGMTASGQAVGMVVSGFVGGLLVQRFGWPSIFVARLPFLLVALALAVVALRGRRAPALPGTAEVRRFDLAGAVMLVATIGLLLIGLNLVAGAPGVVSGALLTLACGAAAGVVWVERRAATPILDLALFRRRAFTVAVSTQFLCSLGVFTIWFILPFFVAGVLGLGARALGVLFGVQGAAMALASPAAGRLADRVHPARVITAAAVAIAAGLLWIASLEVDAGVLDAALPLVLTGVGQGALGTAGWTLVFNNVPGARSGTASGALNLGRSMGVVLSVALFSAIFAAREQAHLGALTATGAVGEAARLGAHVEAFRETFRLGALVVAAGVACSLLAWRTPARAPEASASPDDAP
ncbi:MAG: MFS transporter [Dehalococcoidia bacterium]